MNSNRTAAYTDDERNGAAARTDISQRERELRRKKARVVICLPGRCSPCDPGLLRTLEGRMRGREREYDDLTRYSCRAGTKDRPLGNTGVLPRIGLRAAFPLRNLPRWASRYEKRGSGSLRTSTATTSLSCRCCTLDFFGLSLPAVNSSSLSVSFFGSRALA